MIDENKLLCGDAVPCAVNPVPHDIRKPTMTSRRNNAAHIAITLITWQTAALEVASGKLPCRATCGVTHFSVPGPEQTIGQRVMGHGSYGSTNVNGSRGSRVSTVKHLTHD